jgi:hypothetical protein
MPRQIISSATRATIDSPSQAIHGNRSKTLANRVEAVAISDTETIKNY